MRIGTTPDSMSVWMRMVASPMIGCWVLRSTNRLSDLSRRDGYPDAVP